jgi:hypothetical protein
MPMQISLLSMCMAAAYAWYAAIEIRLYSIMIMIGNKL